MKIGVEASEGLGYKLRMMGVPFDGHIHIKADNMFVVKNTIIPESMFKNKSNLIAYHYVRERAAAGTVVVSHEPADTDMLTENQPGTTRKRLAEMVLF
jgi:hypothetical protein